MLCGFCVNILTFFCFFPLILYLYIKVYKILRHNIVLNPVKVVTAVYAFRENVLLKCIIHARRRIRCIVVTRNLDGSKI